MTAAVASAPLASTSTATTMSVTGTEMSSSADSGVGNIDSKLRLSILNAYLEPLLKKHGLQQDITFEDLMSSKKAADHVIESDGTSDRLSILREELELLHRTQLKAYMEAAEQALRSWIRQQVEAFTNKTTTSGAENGAENSSKTTSDEQEQCVTHVLSMSGTKPNFRVGPNFWKKMVQEVVQECYGTKADAAITSTTTVDTEDVELDSASAQDTQGEPDMLGMSDGVTSGNNHDPVALGIPKDDVIHEEPNEDEVDAEEGEVQDAQEEVDGGEEEEDGQLEDDGGEDDEGKEEEEGEEGMEEEEEGEMVQEEEGTDEKEDTAGNKTTASSKNNRLKTTRKGGKLGQLRKPNNSGTKSGNKTGVGGGGKKVAAVGRRKVAAKASVGGARNTVKAKGGANQKATAANRRSTRVVNK